MAALVLTLDTTPPVAAALELLGGDSQLLTLTADQVVEARLTCSVPPSTLLGEYKLWGDVDPTALGSVQASEGASSWTTYTDPPLVAIRLSAGGGVKNIYGRLRDDLRNQTPVLAAQVLYDPTYPQVSVQTPPDRARLSRQTGFRASTFAWVSNIPFVQYVVRAVVGVGSSSISGSPIGTTSGSAGVAGSGSFLANTPITTTVDASDLAVASPGDGLKVVKVFVRDADGRWSL